jgi:hypothetical protein
MPGSGHAATDLVAASSAYDRRCLKADLNPRLRRMLPVVSHRGIGWDDRKSLSAVPSRTPSNTGRLPLPSSTAPSRSPAIYPFKLAGLKVCIGSEADRLRSSKSRPVFRREWTSAGQFGTRFVPEADSSASALLVERSRLREPHSKNSRAIAINDRGRSGAPLNGSGASASAAPLPQSGGCVRGRPRTAD